MGKDRVRRYRLTKGGLPSMVRELDLYLGPRTGGDPEHWIGLRGEKVDGGTLEVWIRCKGFPPGRMESAQQVISDYVVREGDGQPIRFRNRLNSCPVLPSLGAWYHLIPRPTGTADSGASKVQYLGHEYELEEEGAEMLPLPDNIRTLDLRPDLLIGPAHNTRQRDETRRWDDSDYELVPLSREDYEEMIEAGVTLLRADLEQSSWIQNRDVFFWGIGGSEIPYPEWLYRSNYLGPTIFMDEPAVCTRDRVLRPRLEKDDSFRREITPQMALQSFESYFERSREEEAPRRLIEGLSAREDVDPGDMDFLQENLYTWETMVSTAAYQLRGGSGPPSAAVFEPPGRVGTIRTLPEMNMAYGCQIPVDDPRNLASILYGFLRGAARSADKRWGMSIYGQFHRADAPWFQTHAYDLGATTFTYWDSHKLACVPFHEYLSLTRNLRAHAEENPHRELGELMIAAEVLILIPPGYNLGHVDLGRGNLWGLPELNLERVNRFGVKYRTVMGNLFTEIERCLRLGLSFDLAWDLESLDHTGYGEVVRIREHGGVEVQRRGKSISANGPRTPRRPQGTPPGVELDIETSSSGPGTTVRARATVMRGSAPVYYTVGANSRGVYENAFAMFELYGPEDYDYRFINQDSQGLVIDRKGRETVIGVSFEIESPGIYRLRAATCDMAGRTAVAWRGFEIPG